MADRSGLKLVGFIFATVTLGVMLTAAMVVKTYADGGYTLETSYRPSLRFHALLTIEACNRAIDHRRISGSRSAPSPRPHAASSPTNRIMMVPMLCCECRSGIGSVLSGRTLCINTIPDIPQKRSASPDRSARRWSRRRSR